MSWGGAEGSFAQYVVADHRNVLHIPDGLGLEEASALPSGLFTEHGALQVAGFRSGQSVLITGATSAIGLLGIQIAKALGASAVLATTRHAARTDLLTGVGADAVVVTSEQDPTHAVLKATGGQGVEVVLDHVGGPAFTACLSATRVGGHIVNIGRLDPSESVIDLDALSYRHLTVRGVSYGYGRPEVIGGVMAALIPEVIPAIADGRIRAVVDSTFTFDTAAQAADRLRSHQARGKPLRDVFAQGADHARDPRWA
ncbi:zinc-binding dehydrogenase [Streptomyces sp. NPDC012616]|uniref:quinone oxidoreductase family protein n=1 Tax=Streptomyces sp. NPDC012616 TaxID=3364840 RepID=UPI0036EF68D3